MGASLSLSGGECSFTWTISGLNADFTTKEYICAGLTKNQFAGGVYSISGIVNSTVEYASSNGSTTVSKPCDYNPGKYTFWAFTQVKDGRYWTAGTDTVTVESKKIVVAPWLWTTSNGEANDAETTAAYSAVTNQGTTSNFSYLVWNDFVSKINEVAIASGDAWITSGGYLQLGATKMEPSDKILTAKRFNSAKHNIGNRISTEIQDVSSGDIVMGSYFTTLTDKLNEWIGSL